MNRIGSWLEKYKNFIPPRRAIVRAVCAAVETTLHVQIPEESVSVRNRVAFVQAAGAVKSEILIQKAAILSEAVRSSGIAISDIR